MKNKLSEGIAEASLSQAELLIHQQLFEKGINILKMASVNHSSLWRKHYLLGLCCYGLDRTSDAQIHLRKASELNNHSQLPLLVLREVVPAGPEKYFVDEKLMEMKTQLSESYIESATFLATIGEKLEALRCLRLLLRNGRIYNREIVKTIETVWWQIASDIELGKTERLVATRR